MSFKEEFIRAHNVTLHYIFSFMKVLLNLIPFLLILLVVAILGAITLGEFGVTLFMLLLLLTFIIIGIVYLPILIKVWIYKKDVLYVKSYEIWISKVKKGYKLKFKSHKRGRRGELIVSSFTYDHVNDELYYTPLENDKIKISFQGW